ncbi:MAG: hypothetical protein ACD_42C00522G0002 [uncultured bacterium]|nr:MAG: hypothetical protein ACD_42C00522G0002 [uncultured bacterium]
MKNFQMGKYHPYVWKGTNKWGAKAIGIVVAEDDVSAENETRRLGVAITYLKRRHLWMLPGKADRKIKVKDIVYTMRQLSTLIASGVPLVQSLEIMSLGAEKVRLRALLLTIRDDVATGNTFAEALIHYPEFFSPLICGLINAGEQSGTLDKMVSEVADYLEHHERLKNRVKKAMYYPLTVLTVAILIVIGLLVFLVPRFQKIYASFNAKLPAFTLNIISFSNFVREEWWLILLILFGFIYGYRYLSAHSERFQYGRDALYLKIILFGDLIQKATIARICSTLSITLTAGIPLIDALGRVSKVATNILYRDAVIHARDQVAQGEPMARAFRETQLFPAIVTQMIEIGEKSGSLDMMLRKVGQYYSDQVDTTVDGLTTLIEPLMIIFVGIIVGVFVFAMYLPIFNLGMAIK